MSASGPSGPLVYFGLKRIENFSCKIENYVTKGEFNNASAQSAI